MLYKIFLFDDQAFRINLMSIIHIYVIRECFEKGRPTDPIKVVHVHVRELVRQIKLLFNYFYYPFNQLFISKLADMIKGLLFI